MKRTRTWSIMLIVVLLTVAWGMLFPAGAAQPATDDVALTTFPAELFQGKTQAEIQKELPISGAYRDETTPIGEEVEVEVNGSMQAVTVFRYLTLL